MLEDGASTGIEKDVIHLDIRIPSGHPAPYSGLWGFFSFLSFNIACPALIVYRMDSMALKAVAGQDVHPMAIRHNYDVWIDSQWTLSQKAIVG